MPIINFIPVGGALAKFFQPKREPTRYDISGYTRNSAGVALAGCLVEIYETVSGLLRATTTSDANGYYTVQVTGVENLAFTANAYLDGYGDVMGVTINTLAGTQRDAAVTTPTITALNATPGGSISNGGNISYAATSIILSGTGQAGATVNGYADWQDARTQPPLKYLVNQTQADGSGNWSIQYRPNLGLGLVASRTCELTTIAMDVCNNYSALSAVWSFVTAVPAP